MARYPKSGPPGEGGAKTDDRRARQAAALRENLRKRKRQSRARADAAPRPPREAPKDGGGDPVE